MKTNVGLLDRVIRITVGLALLILYALGQVGPWGLVGLVPLATGLLQFCPLYALLGVRTCARPADLP